MAVEILPWLGEEEARIYECYRFNEEWDSEHNRQLLKEMPAVYRCPLDQANSEFTSYFGLVSNLARQGSSRPYHRATFFWKERGSHFGAITDGTSNSLAIVECKRETPWTKPEDINYDDDEPLPELGGWWNQGWRAALADGSVQFLASCNPESVVRQLIVINDHTVIQELFKVKRLEVREILPPNEHEPRAELDAEQGFYYDPSVAPLVTESSIASIEIKPQSDSLVDIELNLKEAAGVVLMAKTSELVKQKDTPRLAITFDGKLIMAPKVNVPVGKNLVISGMTDRQLIEDVLSHVRREILFNQDGHPEPKAAEEINGVRRY